MQPSKRGVPERFWDGEKEEGVKLSIRTYFYAQYYSGIDDLVTKLKDGFDQASLKIVSDIESLSMPPIVMQVTPQTTVLYQKDLIPG